MKRYTLSGTTSAAGVLTMFARPTLGGRIHSIHIRAAALGAVSAGTTDIAFTASPCGATILILTNNAATGSYYPRRMVCDIAASPATTAMATSVGAWEAIGIGPYGRGEKDEIRVAVTSGGAGSSFTCDIYIEEDTK